MLSLDQIGPPQVPNNHISVQVAPQYSSYSSQYLRCLLRNGRLEGIKIGQLWLVNKGALDACLQQVRNTTDLRFWPNVHPPNVFVL